MLRLVTLCACASVALGLTTFGKFQPSPQYATPVAFGSYPKQAESQRFQPFNSYPKQSDYQRYQPEPQKPFNSYPKQGDYQRYQPATKYPSQAVPYDSYPKRAEYAQVNQPYAPILRSESNINPDGSYQWAYETGNGIAAQEQGHLKADGSQEGTLEAQGQYQYTSPEGVPVHIQYIADENGYQPTGSVLPVAPPIPDAILRSIQYNDEHPEKPEDTREYYKPTKYYS